MRRFSRDIRERLICAGWYEGRDVLQEVNIPKSFNTFPAALRVLREFGNLTLWGKSTIEIDPSLEEGVEASLAPYEAELAAKLCILGPLDEGHGSLVIDELGRVYAMWGVSGDFDLVGANFEQALENLLIGHQFSESQL